jgi:ribonuclease HII
LALAPFVENVTVYLDGSLKAPKEYAQETIIGGDALVPAIMLASVAAKVLRDRLMVELSAKYPAYDFAKHKGYGTAAHYTALRAHGPCEIHRRTFLHLDRKGKKG